MDGTALITAGGALLVAMVAAWSAVTVERTKRQTQANADRLADSRFSMEYHEHRAALALQDADRERAQRRDAERERDYYRRWAERAQREHPDLGDLNPWDGTRPDGARGP